MRRALRPCSVAFRRPSCLCRCNIRSLHESHGRDLVLADTHIYRRYGYSVVPFRRFTSSVLSVPADPTIYALSTAQGRAAIAIIRISGPACTAIYKALCPRSTPLKPRQAAVRSLYEPGTILCPETVLDSSALLLYFPAPKTVTGEDLLELHVHGGTAVVKAVLAAIPKSASFPGQIRYAEPGEFTRRAFMNDRLDLTQVEALGDTLSASTEQQRRLSIRGTTNKLSQRYENWRQQLLYARGELEALIDFSEDQHFDESPAILTASVAHQVRALQVLLEAHSRNAVRGELLRNGISISLLGAPNAGKSSLLNRVVGREAAIVSTEAGTTRDVVEVAIDVGGYLCRLGDTAGLRRALDNAKSSAHHMQEKIGLIEKEGMRRAKERAAESHVVIVVFSLEIDHDKVHLQLDPEVVETVAHLSEENPNILVVLNKTDRFAHASFDLNAARQDILSVLPNIAAHQIFDISCRDAENSSTSNAGNINLFLDGLVAKFNAMTSPLSPDSDTVGNADPSIWQESLGATERHRLLLDECLYHLQQFLHQVEPDGRALDGEMEDHGDVDIVLAAESLRSAANSLSRITGRGDAADTEQVLGVVFEKFCVGK